MSAQTGPDPLDALADHFGIVSDYYDIFGRQHVTSADTKRAILAAMGIKANTAEDVARELAACRDEPWRQPCDPVLVKRAGDAAATWSFRMPVHHQEDRHVQIRWSIQDEQEQFRLTGEAGPNLIPVDTHEIGDQRYVRFDLPLPAISDIGYYTLTAVGSTASTCVEGTLRIILAPARCYEPAGLWHGVRLWGLSLHLYALRSSTNWGVGDFGDLAERLEWAAKI
ncbi:MAG: hypothetical protein ICV76_03385 [Nitrospiraceae bacterium]|nr:hypothetical protein [Nitrospiraceae bacterium]